MKHLRIMMLKAFIITITLGISLPMLGQTRRATIGGLLYILDSSKKTAIFRSKKTAIDSQAEYSGNVRIPNTVVYNNVTYKVTSIDVDAFWDCRGLTSVTIPNSVTSIGSALFKGCTSLTSIIVDKDNPVYDSREGCNAIIKTATNTLIAGCARTFIPESVTSIGKCAFEGSSSLTSVTIPNSITSIGEGAFSGCKGLTAVTIPNSVTSIGRFVFSGCSGLTSIVVDKDNPVYDSREGCNAIIKTATNTLVTGCTNTSILESVTSIGDYAFSSCLTSVTIPNSVTSIGEYAFRGCKGLTAVTIPNSVTNIGEFAFSGCSGLTSVHCLCTNPPIIGTDDCAGDLYEGHVSEYIFFDIVLDDDGEVDIETIEAYEESVGMLSPIFPTLYVPRGSIEAYKNARGWKDFKNIVEEENGNEGNGENDENDEIFEVAEQNPSFPGGEKAQADWIRQNLRYPQSAKEKNIQARVLVQVVVNKDGSIVEPKVLRPVDPDLDKEAIRLISSMPKWIPGKSGGKEIRVRHMIPITFRLN